MNKQPLAVFSPCRRYRYTLWRSWPVGEGIVMFIGLNPSTADETRNDPTVHKCMRYAKAWGFAGMCMANIFAFRATDPKVMKAEKDPTGPENDRYLLTSSRDVQLIVAAWGDDGVHLDRGDVVRALIQPLHHLRLSKAGQPRHPRFLPEKITPTPLPARG